MITYSEFEAAMDTIEDYANQEAAPIIAQAEQEDGSLFIDGREIFWESGTDSIELKGAFSLSELQAICLHVQDQQDYALSERVEGEI